MLLWRPGELTRRYIEGQRARFVSPMAMFLFSVFLMFAVFSSLGGEAFKDRSGAKAQAPALEEIATTRAQTVAELEQQFKADRDEAVSELKALEQARTTLRSMGKDAGPVEQDMRTSGPSNWWRSGCSGRRGDPARGGPPQDRAPETGQRGLDPSPERGGARPVRRRVQEGKRNRSLLAYKVKTTPTNIPGR
jgi:hypothetical protein